MTDSLEKRIFMICPVKGITDEEDRFLKEYISRLESEGYKVHYPPRGDTNQNDPIGLNICSQNRAAIQNSGQVRIYYNPTSTGTVFDCGMTFMNDKKLFVINKQDIILGGFVDDLANFIMQYSGSLHPSSNFYRNAIERKIKIKASKIVEYEFTDITRDFLFDFGMSFMAEKPIVLINRDDVKRTSYKSFQNVLLELDKKYRQKK